MISSGQARKPVDRIALDTGSTNITTSAWVQLYAATAQPCSFLDIFNETTSIIQIAVGGVGSEVALPFYIYGGNLPQFVPVDFLIPKGSRISAKAIDANATTGYLIINMFD
jgi:hypothetical protein